MKGLFITGTDTGVGKTHIACLLARQFIAEGFTPIPRKPVESGCQIAEDSSLIPADALALCSACEYPQPLSTVCPYPLKAAMSPAEAARREQKEIHLDQLLKACRPVSGEAITDSSVLLVEGAGGFYSPLCNNALNADLAEQLGLPVLLVADDKLGCINHILLSIEAIKSRKLNVLAVILNQIQTPPDDINNAAELARLITAPIITTDGTTARLLSQQLLSSL